MKGKEREGERKGEITIFHILVHSPKPGLGQVECRSLEFPLVSHVDGRSLKDPAISCYLPGCIGKKLDQKGDLNQHSDMECKHLDWGLNLMLHNSCSKPPHVIDEKYKGEISSYHLLV